MSDNDTIRGDNVVFTSDERGLDGRYRLSSGWCYLTPWLGLERASRFKCGRRKISHRRSLNRRPVPSSLAPTHSRPPRLVDSQLS